jgi:SNF2 family DNA or RNA helicase
MPLILHAAWLRSDPQVPEGTLFFWAENQDGEAAVAPLPTVGRRRDREAPAEGVRPRAVKVPSHPLQTPVSQLRQLLIEQMPALGRADLTPASAAVWAPTQGGSPLVQRTLLAAAAEHGNGSERRSSHARHGTELAPWQVTGLALEPLAALSCLAHLNNGAGEKSSATATIYHRLRLGKDMLYWSHVAKFALELLINQHYLPALYSHADGYLIAAWQPFVSDERLQERFDHLVQMMPPVCRSYNLTELGNAPSAGQLVEHFVAAVMDASIRQWGAGALPGGAQAAKGAAATSDGDPSGGGSGENGATTSPAALSGAAASPANGDIAPARWLGQLLNGQRRLNLPPQQAYHFYQQWQSWTEQLQYTTETTFRVCFQLEEPESLGDRTVDRAAPLWKLHYLLQARDNPEWRITAREVWSAQTGSIRIGNRRVDQPQERMRAGLSAASRIFDPIGRSLRSTSPESVRLTTDEAYRFLREASALLESSGFGILLPDWWHPDRRAGLGLRMRLAAADEGEEGRPATDAGLNSQVRFSWELTLGGRSLDRDEFEQMAAMRTPLLRLENRWVELDPAQVAAAQGFINEKQPSGIMSLLQAVRVVQSFQGAEDERGAAAEATSLLPTDLLDEMPAILPVDDVDVEGWLGEVIDRLKDQHSSAIVREPEGFVGRLRPYQRRGVGWLWYLRRLGLGACLADDMGLGKTVQAIALLLHVRAVEKAEANGNGVAHRPALLICPTSVVANWRREVERFAPELRVLVHHGGSRLTDDSFMEAVAEHDIIITSFGTARRDIDMLSRWRWSDLILDEAQNIKNPTAKQTQAVRSLAADNRIALTGTPVENRLSELWSIVQFLNPGYLENHERFRQRYIVPIERYNDDDRAAELRRLVQPFLLRRVKSDPSIISDLPEKNEMVVYCSLTTEQAALYEKVVQETLDELDRSEGIQRRGLVLGLLTRLKQITNHPAHYLKQEGPLLARSGKLERLTEMLEEALAVGDHALVFTQFVEMGTLLQRHLRDVFGVEVLFLHGGTPAMQRDQMVQAFQEEDGPPIFILSLRAGGAGLNLTRASHVFHYDRWWNPAVENQATDRAFRIGQRRNVQVHKYVVAGTLEERIHAIVEGKQSLADTIVGSGEQWLTELSTDQLRDLLTLRKEMVEDL